MEFLNPTEVLNKLELKDDMVAADFGSGSGGWVLPLAGKLSEGKVYAIDVLPEPISVLKSRMKSEKIFNIQTIRSDIESKKGSTLALSSLDLVLMTNLLFECDDKKKVLEEGKRVLRPGGKILVVDWIKDNPLTKEIEYVSFDEIKEIAKNLNLKLEKEFAAGSYHYGLVFKKVNEINKTGSH